MRNRQEITAHLVSQSHSPAWEKGHNDFDVEIYDSVEEPGDFEEFEDFDTDERPAVSLDWSRQIKSLMAAFSSSIRGRLEQSAKISELESRIRQLEEQRQTFQTTINAFDSSRIQLLKPIPVTVLDNGDDVIASFYEANISGSGETDQEAFEMLSFSIESIFISYTSHPENRLGVGPRKQLNLLRQFLSLSHTAIE